MVKVTLADVAADLGTNKLKSLIAYSIQRHLDLIPDNNKPFEIVGVNHYCELYYEEVINTLSDTGNKITVYGRIFFLESKLEKGDVSVLVHKVYTDED